MATQDTRITVLEKAYENLEKRMDSIEVKLDEMKDEIKSNNHHMTKVIIGSAGTVTGAVLSTLVVVLTQVI